MTAFLTEGDISSSFRPQLALASSNPGKIAEFRAILGEDINLVSLIDLGLSSPEETGSTFEANAELKARYVFEHCGLVTLADDSGLEVDALEGRPGVMSARYAGDGHEDAANRALLLRTLGSLPDGKRTARFVAVIAFIDGQGELTLSRGTCEGRITFEERGSGGFGYDSLLELADGRTLAEVDSASKNVVSHRANAMRRALPTVRAALDLPQLEEGRLTR